MRWLAPLVVPILLFCASLVDTTPATTKLPYVQCKRTYRKIGCFDMKLSPAQTYLINDRDPKSKYFQGHELSWIEFEESIHRYVSLKELISFLMTFSRNHLMLWTSIFQVGYYRGTQGRLKSTLDFAERHESFGPDFQRSFTL